MKSGWTRKSLSVLTTKIGSGATPSGGEASYKKDGISLIRSLNVHDTGFRYKDLAFIDGVQAGLLSNAVVEPDDVLLNITGASVARCCTVPEDVLPARVNQHVTILRPVNETVLTRYLYYLLISPDTKNRLLNAGEAGSTRQALTKALLESFCVELPQSLKEQERIVGILDEAFEGIAVAKANAEKNLQNARALFESRLQSVFAEHDSGWVEKPLEALCDIKHGFAFKSEFFADSGEYTLLTPGNFYESGGYRDRGVRQKYYCGEVPDGFILSEGDLLVAMTEQAAGLLGSPILVPTTGKFLHNQRLGLVKGKPGVPWTNEFFFQVFNTPAVRKEIHDGASGVKVRHTSPAKIGEVVVTFPLSVTEQLRIVSALKELTEETQQLELVYKRKLSALDELKTSLLHQAFSGGL